MGSDFFKQTPLDFDIIKQMIKKENVKLDSLGITLVGTLFVPEKDGKLPAVIMCHGAGDIKENLFPLAEFLANKGIVILCVDLHGHGESGGTRSNVIMREWQADVFSAIRHLENHPRVDKNRIGAFGISSGGTAVLEVAALGQDLKSLVVLDATVCNSLPFLMTLFLKILIFIGSIKKFFTGRDLRFPLAKISGDMHIAADPELNQSIQADPRFKATFNNFPFPGGAEVFFVDTIKRVGNITAPTLVIWGSEDKIDPPESGKLLYTSLKCKKDLHIIPGNGHIGHMDTHKDVVFALTLDWFIFN